MEEAKKTRRRGKRGRGQAGQHAAAVESLLAAQALSGWDGANASTRRGYIYWPTTDTRKELTDYSFNEILKKSRWLRANNGLSERIVSGLADLIGYLTPVAATGDEEWNEAAEDLWNDRAEEPAVFDNQGRYSARLYQLELDRSAFGDGDVLSVISDGNPSGGLRISLYEAHQLRTPENLSDAQGKWWFHGVRIDKFRRPREFSLLDPDAAEVRTVRLGDDVALHYCHPDRPGRIRPPSILARGITRLVDVNEILGDYALAIKAAAQWGIQIQNDSPTSNLGARSVASGLRDETVTRTLSSGATENVTVKWEDFFSAQGGLMNLPTGAKAQVLADSRPHPNVLGLVQHYIRDIAWGAGVAPDLLWDIATLRGANNRLLNADLGRWIAQRLLRKRSHMKRLWTLFLAKEMTAGRLAPCRDPKWWLHTWIPQASITADRGREGQLNLEEVRMRTRSLATHFGEQGKYWLRELRQVAKERRKLASLGITVDEAVAAAPPPPTRDEEIDDDTEPELLETP